MDNRPEQKPGMETPADILEHVPLDDLALATDDQLDEASFTAHEIEETDPTTDIDSSANPMVDSLSKLPTYLSSPVRFFRTYNLGNLQFDLVAGLTVGVIALPQVIAFALIAELPPEMGL